MPVNSYQLGVKIIKTYKIKSRPCSGVGINNAMLSSWVNEITNFGHFLVPTRLECQFQDLAV